MSAEETQGIRPCRLCGHPTRSPRVPAGKAPGTRERRNGGCCRVCANKSLAAKQRVTADTPPEVIQRRHEATLTALDAFMRARNARIERNRRVLA